MSREASVVSISELEEESGNVGEKPKRTAETIVTPGLRRSTRKRKSVTESDPELEDLTKKVGKRHRPLGGTMAGGLHRTPETTGKRIGRTPNSQTVQAGPVPDQPTTSGSTHGITLSTDPPTVGEPTSEHMILLGGMRAVVAEELKKSEERMSGRLAGVEQGVTELRSGLANLEERVDKVERSVEERMDELLAERNIVPTRQRSLRSDQPILEAAQSTRETRYWKARKSLRIWPVRGSGNEMHDNLMRFLVDKLKVGEDVLEDVNSCHIRRVPKSNSPNVTHEIVVEFPTIDVRDAIKSSAFNLAGDRSAGIRLEVAHHLMSNFKALSNASFKIKKKFPQCKRNLRYDDDALDLILDFKPKTDSPWKRLRPEQARIIEDTDGRVEEMSASDVSEMLELEDDDTFTEDGQ